jgi:hypothetical protein bacD2_02475|nr:MAG TPA: hypothetical protein [Caudoviricetes sp.]
MENKYKVCGECRFFIDEDAFGNGWCDKHNKECFCENGSCMDVEDIVTKASIGEVASHMFCAGADYQREVTRRHAVEVCKQMCPSKVSRGCANLLHKRETKTTCCDGNCARVKYFINGLDKQEL